jgi:RNA polymerase sigma-70 factor, ECF subfamily
LSVIPLPRPDRDRPDVVSGVDDVVHDADRDRTRSVSSSVLRARIASREIAPAGDEAELAHRLAAGDPAALTAITEWLWESLAAYAYRLVEDRDAARDIAQEACVRLWQRRGHDSPRSVRPYLFRVVRNLALDHLKTRRARRRLLQRQDPGRTRRPARPDEVMENDRVSTRVQQSIQELPDRRREVFVLAYLRGLSYADIGEVLGISPKTVQNQMTAALAQLRTALRPLVEERRTATGRSQ